MKKIGKVIWVFLVFVQCYSNSADESFRLHGVIKNIPDSTVITLERKNMIVADSTWIIGGRFEFSGKIERPSLVMLRIKSTRDHKMFWLENTKIEVIGEKGNLINSKIVGSKTQREADMLREQKSTIFAEYDRIDKLVTDENRDSLFVLYNQLIAQEVAINKKFIQEFPDSYESLFRLSQSKEKMEAEETNKLFIGLSEELKSTEEGKSIAQYLKLNRNLKVGDRYVDFEQSNIHGKQVRFSDMQGKYILLEFWASWCGPCRAFNPELVAEYAKYKDKGFEILGVSLDTDEEKWKTAVIKDQLTWENVCDLKGSANEAAQIYGVQDLPDNFLIDENGVIIARYLRGEELKSKLKELFN